MVLMFLIGVAGDFAANALWDGMKAIWRRKRCAAYGDSQNA